MSGAGDVPRGGADEATDAGDHDARPDDARAEDARADDARAEAIRVDIRRGDPTPEELAAVVAVVTEAYRTEAASALAEAEPRPSAWRVSARLLREPLRREIGWGRFGG